MLKIKQLRKRENLTQSQLAEKLGFTQTQISNWERGRTEPDMVSIMEMALFFDVKIDYLLGYKDEFGNKLKR